MATVATTIRLKKAAQRLNKKVYPDCKIKKDIVKKHETIEMLDKNISDVWSIIYSKGFVAGVDNSNPAFYEDFDLLELLHSKLSKTTKSMYRKIEKNNLDLDEILNETMRLNVRLNTSF